MHQRNLDDHVILLLKQPKHVPLNTVMVDTPIGIVHSESEANRRLYQTLLMRAPDYVRGTNEFRGFYDLTGSKPRYNHVTGVHIRR